VTYPTSCHNLIHEDHEMLAAFNVTALADFGYNETTRFIDPMEKRYRAVDFSDSDYSSRSGPFSESGIKDKLNFFIGLDAYNNIDGVESALAAYWATPTPGTVGSAMRTTTFAASPSASGASTASGPAMSKSSFTSLASTTLKTSTRLEEK
jgi:bilirubin oxidase